MDVKETIATCVFYAWYMFWMYLHIRMHQEMDLQDGAKCKLGKST